ncbi:unnamed protein product [Prorocentrum cordatum]|uniref:ADF-H domain-containing protein n=1 Tax=Prorocentrum cordatum TaxID=2364126 RepID=A0ABN9TPT5_9DINO|nr:unnamed protein product [Polarella glacialis]
MTMKVAWASIQLHHVVTECVLLASFPAAECSSGCGSEFDSRIYAKVDTTITSFMSKPGGLENNFPGQTTLRIHGDFCEGYSKQAYRLFSYQFTHGSMNHVLSNSFAILFFGSPLELLSGSLWLFLLFQAGVLGGGLCTWLTSAHTNTVGASGGSYALIGMQIGNMVLNWRQKRFRMPLAAFFFIFLAADMFNFTYTKSSTTSYSTHAGGLITGLLAQLVLGRKLVYSRRGVVMRGFAIFTLFGLGVLSCGWYLVNPFPAARGVSELFYDPGFIGPWCWVAQACIYPDYATDGSCPSAWQCVGCQTRKCVEDWYAFAASSSDPPVYLVQTTWQTCRDMVTPPATPRRPIRKFISAPTTPGTPKSAAVGRSPLVVLGAGRDGVEGLQELVDEAAVQWALIRFELGGGSFVRHKLVFLHFNGEDCPAMRRGQANSLTSEAQNLLRKGNQEGFHASLSLTRKSEVTVSEILDRVSNFFVKDDIDFSWQKKTSDTGLQAVKPPEAKAGCDGVEASTGSLRLPGRSSSVVMERGPRGEFLPFGPQVEKIFRGGMIHAQGCTRADSAGSGAAERLQRRRAESARRLDGHRGSPSGEMAARGGGGSRDRKGALVLRVRGASQPAAEDGGRLAELRPLRAKTEALGATDAAMLDLPASGTQVDPLVAEPRAGAVSDDDCDDLAAFAGPAGDATDSSGEAAAATADGGPSRPSSSGMQDGAPGALGRAVDAMPGGCLLHPAPATADDRTGSSTPRPRRPAEATADGNPGASSIRMQVDTPAAAFRRALDTARGKRRRLGAAAADGDSRGGAQDDHPAAASRMQDDTPAPAGSGRADAASDGRHCAGHF